MPAQRLLGHASHGRERRACAKGVFVVSRDCGGRGARFSGNSSGLWVPGRRRDRSSTRETTHAQSSWGGSEGGRRPPTRSSPLMLMLVLVLMLKLMLRLMLFDVGVEDGD